MSLYLYASIPINNILQAIMHFGMKEKKKKKKTKQKEKEKEKEKGKEFWKETFRVKKLNDFIQSHPIYLIYTFLFR